MATVRLYAELNEFLPPQRRRDREVRHPRPTPAGDLLRSMGVPITEVDLILVNGESVDTAHPVAEGDRVSVYPVFESFDITPLQRLRTRPLRRPRFLLDVHLGRLARLLRMLGIDAAYHADAGDDELRETARREGRALLSRDRDLVAHPDLDRAYLVRSQRPDEQLREVLERFQLQGCARPLTRCLRCNTTLEAAAAGEVRDRIPPRVLERHREFRRCPVCRRVYWMGTHAERMTAMLLHLTRKS